MTKALWKKATSYEGEDLASQRDVSWLSLQQVKGLKTRIENANRTCMSRKQGMAEDTECLVDLARSIDDSEASRVTALNDAYSLRDACESFGELQSEESAKIVRLLGDQQRTLERDKRHEQWKSQGFTITTLHA